MSLLTNVNKFLVGAAVGGLVGWGIWDIQSRPIAAISDAMSAALMHGESGADAAPQRRHLQLERGAVLHADTAEEALDNARKLRDCGADPLMITADVRALLGNGNVYGVSGMAEALASALGGGYAALTEPNTSVNPTPYTLWWFRDPDSAPVRA